MTDPAVRVGWDAPSGSGRYSAEASRRPGGLWGTPGRPQRYARAPSLPAVGFARFGRPMTPEMLYVLVALGGAGVGILLAKLVIRPLRGQS